MNLVDTLSQERPQLHAAANDPRPCDFHTNVDCLRDLQALVHPHHVTLETGCGWSTIIFAASGAEHWCISPKAVEIEQVKQYCESRQIPTARVQFQNDRSETALPRLNHDLIVDVALIDGRRAFPTPIVDWYYIARHLRTGGKLVVDDTDIRSCHILYQFLSTDTNWELSKQGSNYAIFTKLGDDAAVEWWRQQNFSKTKVGPWGIMERAKFWLGRLIKNR